MNHNSFKMLINFLENAFNQVYDNTMHNDIISRNYEYTEQKIHSSRIFSYWEKYKLTKSSYQFIMRLIEFNIIATETMEYIINQLTFSESKFVTLDETKLVVRDTLADNLNANQLLFLDLILSHNELPVH